MKGSYWGSVVIAVLLFGFGGWLLFGAQGEAVQGEAVQGEAVQAETSANSAGEAGANPSQSAKTLLRGDFTLAVSWQPAFCETAPGKPECKSQTKTRFDARNFTLHGLWPDPAGRVYCDVSGADRRADKSGRWSNLPAPKISPRLQQALEIMMPGTQSGLDRHEWIKHGTCAGASAQNYYAGALALLSRLNDSKVQDVFATRVGGRVDANEIRGAFDRAFGPGAGQRVTVECERLNGRTLISELRISVSGAISADPAFGRLLDQAPTRHRGCPGGEIDRVGIGR